MIIENNFLWSCVWQSTVCVLAGLTLSFALRHWPARAHRAVLLSIVSAIVVPLMNAGVKHMEWGLLAAKPEIVQPQDKQAGVAELVSNYELVESAAPVGVLKVNTELVSAPIKTKVTIPWGQVFLWIWIIASVVLIGRVIVSLVLGIRIVVLGVPLECVETERALLAAKRKLGVVKRVRLYCNEKVLSPVIWCWCREPVLLLSSRSGQKDEALDWESVFCHELAHWKRWDHVSGMLAEIVVCVFPWNPVFWWAKRRLVGLSEQACDDWVVSCGQRSTDYAESLLGMVCQRQMAFTPAVVRSKRGLAERIGRITQDRCSNPHAGGYWVLAATLLAVVCSGVLAFAQTRAATISQQVEGEAVGEGGTLAIDEERGIEEIIEAIRHAQRPSNNILVEWTYELSGEARGVTRHQGAGKKINKRGAWTYTYTTVLSGIRSRVDILAEYYPEDSNSPSTAFNELRVFNGTTFKSLKEYTSGGRTEKSPVGTIYAENKNGALWQRKLFDDREYLNLEELRKKYKVELQTRAEANTYIVDLVNEFDG